MPLAHDMVFLYENPEQELDVISSLPLERWQQWNDLEPLMIGFSEDELWARVELISEKPTTTEWILEWPVVYLNDTDCYVIRNRDGEVVAQHPEPQKDTGLFFLKKAHVRFDLEGGESVTVFVRMISKAHLSSDFHLYDPSTYARVQEHRLLAVGLWVGMILTSVVFVCLFIWSTKDLSAFYFLVSYLISFVVLAAFFGILPADQRLPFVVYKFLLTFGSTAIFTFMLLHACAFLDLEKQHPRMTQGIKRGAFFLLAAGAMLFCAPYRAALITLDWIIMAILVLIVTVFIVMRSKRIVYWLYLTAYGVMLCYYFAFVLYFYVPQLFHFNLEFGGMAMLALVMMLCLTAFVVRMHHIQADREKLQYEHYALQHTMTHRLEQQVAVRTRELEQTRKEAEQARDAAQQAYDNKTRFFGRISHDLRAPVNWLIGLSESLALQSRKLQLSDEFTEYLRQVQRGGIYLNQLLNNVLATHAIASDEKKLVRTVFSLSEWSEGLHIIAETLADTGEVCLRWQLDLGGDQAQDRCFSESVYLSQILMNLVHNAIRFTPQGRRMQVDIQRKPDALHFQVADEGPGLPGHAEDLFDRFKQERRQGDVRLHGVGLGLHIVREYVEALDGTVTWQNGASGGAVFCVTIPVTNEEGAAECV